jgi:hypothetical protein
VRLTRRGEWLLVIVIIAVLAVGLTVCLAIGQDAKRDRLNEGGGLIPPVSYTR